MAVKPYVDNPTEVDAWVRRRVEALIEPLILSALGLEKSTSYGQEIKIKDNSPILATVKKAALGFVQELIDKTVADAQAEVKWTSVLNDAIIRDMKKLYRDTFERHAREQIEARAKADAKADVDKFFAGVVEAG